jgi:hypothetical protein
LSEEEEEAISHAIHAHLSWHCTPENPNCQKNKNKNKRFVASGKEFCEEGKKNNNTGAPPHLDTVSELRFGSGEDLLS